MNSRGKPHNTEPLMYRLLRYIWIPAVVISVIAVLVIANFEALSKLHARWVHGIKDPTIIRLTLAKQTPVEVWLTPIAGSTGPAERHKFQPGDQIDFHVTPNSELKFLIDGPWTRLGELAGFTTPDEGQIHHWRVRTRPSREGFYVVKAQRSLPATDPEQPLIVEQQAIPAQRLLDPLPPSNAPIASLDDSENHTEKGQALQRYLALGTALTSVSETGRTDCKTWGRFFFEQGEIAVGCFGYSFSRSFQQLLEDAEQREADLIETHFGNNADFFNSLLEANQGKRMSLLRIAEENKRQQLNAQIAALVQSPAMQAALEEQYLRHLGMASSIADAANLQSERALLMLFDGSISIGNHVRVFPAWLDKHEPDARSKPESAKLRLLHEFLVGPFARTSKLERMNRRCVLFVDGRATIRGVRIDLDELGVGLRDFRSGEPLS